MVAKIARILSACGVLILLTDARPAVCEGWSLLHPFTFNAKTESQTKKPATVAVKNVKREPSLLEKAGTGTKQFFNQAGETLGLKKAAPKKPQYATAIPPRIQPPKKPESKPWYSRLMPEEPKKDKTVNDWLSKPRLDP
jgi:hypothetical protein